VQDTRTAHRVSAQPQPAGEGRQLLVHVVGHLGGERDVLVDGVHGQPAVLAVGRGVDLADQPVVVQDRQGEVPPPPRVPRLVHLQDVLDVEELQGPAAVVHQPVERREQRGAAGERPTDRLRVHAPLPGRALDDRRLTGVADVGRLDRMGRGGRPGQAERPQAPGVPLPHGVVEGQSDDVRRVDPSGQVPPSLLALASGDGHLPPGGEHLAASG
jgi:hypothetical protein